MSLDHSDSKVSRNFEELENRCANLEKLLQKLNLDIGIERASRTMTTSSKSNGSSPEVQWCAESAKENAPSANKFEWNESPITSPSQTDDLDGIASLPTGSTDSGYLSNTTRIVAWVYSDSTSRKQLRVSSFKNHLDLASWVSCPREFASDS